MSDSLGRLRAIAIGSVVGVFVYVPLLLATRWEWAPALRVGGDDAFDWSGKFAFIADHSAPEAPFGITQTLFGVVSVVGPVLGGYLVEAASFKGMLAVAAALYLAATVSVWRAKPQKARLLRRPPDLCQLENQPGSNDRPDRRAGCSPG